MNPPDSHCSRCGTRFEKTESYPRHCTSSECGAQTWANPVPVAVVLVPVASNDPSHGERTGLLVIRRGIEPAIGKLALVGGFVDAEESWQNAGAREVFEETGLRIEAAPLLPFWFTSTEPRPNRVLLFSTAETVNAADLPDFEVSNETTERGVIYGPDGLDEIFAFDLHAQAARRWFRQQEIAGPCNYAKA